MKRILIIAVLAALTLPAGAQLSAPSLDHMAQAARAAYEKDRARVRENAALLERQNIVAHAIDVSVDPYRRSLSGRDRLTIALKAEEVELALEPSFTVTAVTDGAGSAIPFRYVNGRLSFVPSGEGQRDVVAVVSYRSHDLRPDGPDGSNGFLLLSPDASWYPNSPGHDPALLRITVRYPAELVSVCTGTLSGMVPPSETTDRYPVGDIWEAGVPVRAAGLLVAPLDSEWGFRGRAGVSVHRRRGVQSESVPLTEVKALLRFLESCYGAYPFDWLHVVVTSPDEGAPGPVVHGPGFVVVPAATPGDVAPRAVGPLAATWWDWAVDAGPLVADGIAGCAELRWLEAAGDDEEVIRRRELRRYQYVRALIESGGSLALSGCLGPTPCDDARLSMGKGTAVFEMLEFIVGQEAFCSALSRVSEEWRGGQVPFGQIVGAVEESAGRSLDWFVYDWVVRGDLPTYSLEYDVSRAGAGRSAVRGIIHQDGEAYRTPIPLTVDLGGWAYEDWVEIGSADQPFELVTETEPLEIRIDASKIIPKLDPDERAHSHYELGLAAARANEWGRAVGELGAAARLAQDQAAYWFEYGEALVRSGRLEPGIEAVERALELSPDAAFYRSFLTRMYLSSERYEEALASARLLLGSDPDDIVFRSDEAVALVGLGRLEEAAEVLAATRSLLDEVRAPLTTTERFYVAVGVYYEAAGSPEEAEAAYRYALRVNPLSDEARRGIERVGAEPAGSTRNGDGASRGG
jgi:Flp pilus assembly protein TadD